MIDELKHHLDNFFENNKLNRLPKKFGKIRVFANPLLGVAKGDDQIFEKFKKVVNPQHFTPIEFWLKEGKKERPPSELRILSVVFPFSEEIRKGSKNWIESNGMKLPALIYCLARNYASAFQEQTCKQIIRFFEEKGFDAIAGISSPRVSMFIDESYYSNWSERHAAFAAGLGTFSLHEGLITEVGCNVRFGSVVTDAPLDVTPRLSDEPYGNCLYYSDESCMKCVENCPSNAISEQGHDKQICHSYLQKIEQEMKQRIGPLLKAHYRYFHGMKQIQESLVGCAFCQFDVPCMDKNPILK
jgi:epoxyqueuosine reductase